MLAGLFGLFNRSSRRVDLKCLWMSLVFRAGTPWELDFSDPEFTEELPTNPLPWEKNC